ncbi:unnamed protein product [Rotaria sp. Silwood1]|nr:unnamed protein product [Rotaria sp. Silwood1]
MAGKRPTIHPFFTVMKRRQTESTEDTKSIADLSTPINDVNSEKIPDEDTSLSVVDDELQENASSSFVDDQSEEQLSKCELACCTSSTVYVPVTESELQSTSMKDKRSCQASWFKIFSYVTFCKTTKKVYCFYCRAAFSQNLHRANDLSTNMSFISAGFCAWENALRTLPLHNHSKFHSECFYVIQQQSKPSIISQIDTVAKRQQE